MFRPAMATAPVAVTVATESASHQIALLPLKESHDLSPYLIGIAWTMGKIFQVA